MKITFLGTNSWYTTEAGYAICSLVETDKYYFVFDAGEGFWKLNEQMTRELPVYLFLTHLHLDHVYGLHILPRMKFKERLTIVIPESKHDDLMRLAKSPFTASLEKMGIKVISVKVGKSDALPFSCDCLKLKHQDESFGYRIEADGKAVAYCTDTAYCAESITLAKNSDVLIHECTNKPNFKDPGWGHSNPEEAAKIAKEANARKLFLTHFMPDFYPTLESRKEAEQVARKTFQNSFAALDNMTVEV